MPPSTPPPLNYDPIAPTYDSRYRFRDLTGAGHALLRLARRVGQAVQPDLQARVLEAGCGTGHWLAKLHAALPHAAIVGIDPSAGMLAQARQQLSLSNLRPVPVGESRGEVGRLDLLQGRAADLPFPAAAFNLLFCINALHHFPRPETFIAAARRVLAPGGALFIVIMDPHTAADVWTVYDYFPETRRLDLERFPSGPQVRRWLRQAGFTRVRTRPVEKIQREYTGAQVFADPILGRLGTSQLALLSDAEYTAGIERMRAEIQRGGGAAPPVFRTQITLWGTVGYVDNSG